MIENSSAGLVLLEAEVTVTVTREEHHQRELAGYAVSAGRERHVAVELGWCTIGSGKYRGQHAIEVRLDGYRVGELTYLMSQRYAPLVAQVAGQGGRPGCEATVQLGARGLEVTLRLPRSGEALAPVLPQQHKPIWKRPGWITAAAVVFVLFIASLANNDEEPSSSSDAAGDRTTTASAAPTTTTTTTPPPTTTTTTTVAPAPPPVVVDPVETVTEEPAPPPPPPPAPEPDPAPACDPNYSGCVPVDSDVDCAGGSGNGPSYADGPVRVIGSDIYDLDRDGDGTACDG